MKQPLTLLLVALSTALSAQSPAVWPTFEVASIRRNSSLAAGGTAGVQPGGRYTATNLTVVSLIGMAYGVPSQRVLGAPAWAETERYDILAKAPGSPTLQELPPFIQSLLRDRFSLVARRETRELPVHELKVVRADGRLGANIRPNPIDCADPEARKRTAANPVVAGRASLCSITFGTERYVASGQSMSSVARTLSGATSGRPVIDRTGLTGAYDYELEWSSDPNSDKPSFFTAVQEQLGLKLDSATAPLDVIVVERVERPTEN